jgi:hypothetical protein
MGFMSLLRSKASVVLLLSAIVVLLVIFLDRTFESRIPEKFVMSHPWLPSKPGDMDQRDDNPSFPKDRRDPSPSLNSIFRSYEEIPLEIRTLPRESIRESLALVIEERFPDLRLPEKDLHELTEAIGIVQKSMREMRELERARRNLRDLKSIHHELNQALDVIAEITRMSPTEFILLGRPEDGIANDALEDEEIAEEYLHDFKP